MRSIFLAIPVALVCGSEAKAISEWDQMYLNGGALGKITLQVRDDMGALVDGANVESYFSASPKGISQKGRTGRDGSIVAEGKSTGDVRFTIEKEGYYQSSKPYHFAENAPSQKDAIKSGRWMPWNATVTMTLKKFRNPVPMHATSMRSMSVTCDKAAGFDLEAEDLVAPFGKGVVPDLLFHVRSAKENGRESYTWSCSFSNSRDGIQVLEMDSWSKFPWVYEAPADGYLNQFGPFEHPQESPRHPEDTRFFYYVFRVRTKTDANGRIVSAKYGKMYTGINVYGRTDVKLTFRIGTTQMGREA